MMMMMMMFPAPCEQRYELCIPLVVFGLNSLIRLFTYFFSAGVGRSGAYIVIHSMIKRMHVTGDINVFDFLSQIRQQRNHLVQEEVSRAWFKCKSNLKPCFHPCYSVVRVIKQLAFRFIFSTPPWKMFSWSKYRLTGNPFILPKAARVNIW